MSNKATDHKFTYVTKDSVKVRAGRGVIFAQTGSVDKGVEVYADEMPITGTDGMPWLLTTVGYICARYLELKYDKVPSPTPPPPPTPGEVGALIA